jgi:hypothetical protein
MVFVAEIFQYILFGLFTGLIFFKIGDDQLGVRDRYSSQFLLICCLSFIPALTAVVTVNKISKTKVS